MKSLKDCFCVQAFKALLRSSSTLALVFIGLVFGSQNAYAEDINITLEMTQPDELNLAPEVLNTTSQTVSVETNSPGGYNLVIETEGNLSDLSLIDSDTGFKIPTISLPNGHETVQSTMFGYGYGYSLDATNYRPAPGVGGDIIDTTMTANTGLANAYTLTYGVKIPTDTAAGTYTRSFLITATVNEIDACPDEHICYDKNDNSEEKSSNGKKKEMEDQEVEDDSRAVLLAPKFKREGYGFVGWNTSSDGNGTFYGPNETIDTGDLSQSGLTLYAIWLASSGSLQGWTKCETMSIGDRIALTDSRDGNVYVVTKLPDGVCWMTENLRLDLSDSNVQITVGNTNNPTESFMVAANAHPDSSLAFCTNDSDSCVNRVQYNNIHTQMTEENATYEYGIYYNWYTATAGNGTRSFTNTSGTAEGDICPKGWHLPTGNAGGDLTKLDIALGGTGKNVKNSTNASEMWRTFPVNTTFSGVFKGGVLDGLRSTGNYQASTANSTIRSNNLWMTIDSVNVSANGDYKYRGQTMRCMAVNTFTVEFDKNTKEEVTDLMPSQTFIRGMGQNLLKNTMKVVGNETTGYVFTGWNTQADGKGTSFIDEDFVKNLAGVGETVTLYAQWQKIIYVQVAMNFVGDGVGSVSLVNDKILESFTVTENGQSVKLVSGQAYDLSMMLLSHYDFVGWSVDSGKLGSATDNPTTFTPDKNATLTITTEERLNLLYLQDMDYNSCSTTGTIAYDKRDGQEYLVKKLADGECWMLDSLRLGAVELEEPISSENTNISVNNNFVLPASSNIGSYTEPKIMTGYSETIVATSGAGSGKRGVYYNYCAASGGTLCSDNSLEEIEEDICPAGWRLPDGNKTTGEFFNLYGAYGSNASKVLTELSTTLSGYFNAASKTFYNVGKDGYYWSSTHYNANKSFMLDATSSKFNYGGGGLRNNGLSIRCIMK